MPCLSIRLSAAVPLAIGIGNDPIGSAFLGPTCAAVGGNGFANTIRGHPRISSRRAGTDVQRSSIFPYPVPGITYPWLASFRKVQAPQTQVAAVRPPSGCYPVAAVTRPTIPRRRICFRLGPVHVRTYARHLHARAFNAQTAISCLVSNRRRRYKQHHQHCRHLHCRPTLQ